MKAFTKTDTNSGFSLIELMVAMGILSVLLLMMTSLLDQIQRSWRFSESRISQFREARVAFDLVSKNLGQATMHTYWDLVDEDDDNEFDRYEKTSQLHFLSMKAEDINPSSTNYELTGHAVFFQAPLGYSTQYRNLNNLFNGRGYFVGFGSDEDFKPSFVQSDPKMRFRLFEFRPPAEENQVFADGLEERSNDSRQEFQRWFKHAMNLANSKGFKEHLNPLAENIITMVVSPRDSISHVGADRKDTFSDIAPTYSFDSNLDSAAFEKYAQQVPPLVRLTMVAIDEASAVREIDGNGGSMPNLVNSNLFSNTNNYETDIQTLVDDLNEKEIKHKVFSTLVMLRSSKWSEFELNP